MSRLTGSDALGLFEAYQAVYAPQVEKSSEEIDEAEKWIQKAIKKPGALHKQLGVPEGEKIPAGKLAAAAEKGGKLGKRARLAQTLSGFHEEVECVDEDMRPIYGRGGAQRRTQTPKQIGVKGAVHNIPKGGTTVGPSDPSGRKLATGEYDRGKGSKAARRVKALQANKSKPKSFPNRLRRADGQGIQDSYEYDIYDIILSHLLDEGYADTQESALVIMANMSEEWRDGIIEEFEQLDEISADLALRASKEAGKRAGVLAGLSGGDPKVVAKAKKKRAQAERLYGKQAKKRVVKVNPMSEE